MTKWIMIIALSLSAVAYVAAQKIPHGVNLSWTWSGTGTPSYTVYRGTSPGGEAKLASGITTTTYSDTTAVVGQQYYFTVTATVGGVESAPSAEVGALITVPSSPTGPSTSIY